MTGVLSRPTLVKQKVGMRGAYISHCPNLDMISLIKSIANGYINGYTYTPYTPIYSTITNKVARFFLFSFNFIIFPAWVRGGPQGEGGRPRIRK